MKKLLFLVFIYSCAPTNQTTTNTATSFEKIVEVNDQTKDELFTSINTWLAKTFVSSENVIEYSDKEAGKVIGHIVFEGYDVLLGTWYGKSTIEIDVKENKCRFQLNNPRFRYHGATNYRVATGKKLSKFNEDWERVYLLFKEGIEKKEDW